MTKAKSEGIEKSKAAQRLGKMGGNARAAKLNPEQRSGIAKKAAQARWEAYRQRQALKEYIQKDQE